MLRIAHIINTVKVGKQSDLHSAQPVTFETMRRARDFSADTVTVQLYSAQFPEDVDVVPDWIVKTPDLESSILNVGKFQKSRKLPLIKDILDRLYEASEADYFIYTNVDIALMPHFYLVVAQLIESGIDGMVINRRTIANTPCELAQLPLMWAQAGEEHPGYDCFVFQRGAYPDFELGTSCIGVNWIGKVLLANVYAHSENFKTFADLHLTFHLGDDRSWKVSDFYDYDLHNERQLHTILKNFESQGWLDQRDLLKKFLSETSREQDTDHIKPAKRKWWFSCG